MSVPLSRRATLVGAAESGTYARRDGATYTGTHDFTGATVTGVGSGTVADATTTTKGVVQLAGDLGGTAAAPTVPALASKVSTSDSRLSDARTPTAHAATHGSAGTDPVTVATSQVSGFTSAAAAAAPVQSVAGKTGAVTLVAGDVSAVALASGITVVNAGTNLSTARPAGVGCVLWKFSTGVNTGTNGSAIVNGQPGDLIFVAS